MFIAAQDSHKLGLLSGMPKSVPKERGKSIERAKGWKHRRQLSKRLSIQILRFPRIASLA